MGVVCYPLCVAEVISSACQTSVVFCPPSCAFNHHSWDNCWGVKNQLVEGTCACLLSSCSIGTEWRGKFTIVGCWGSLFGASITWIPLVWKHGCSYEWAASWTGCGGILNFDCLLTTIDIFYTNLN